MPCRKAGINPKWDCMPLEMAGVWHAVPLCSSWKTCRAIPLVDSRMPLIIFQNHAVQSRIYIPRFLNWISWLSRSWQWTCRWFATTMVFVARWPRVTPDMDGLTSQSVKQQGSGNCDGWLLSGSNHTLRANLLTPVAHAKTIAEEPMRSQNNSMINTQVAKVKVSD